MKNILLVILICSFFACKKEAESVTPSPTPIVYPKQYGTYSLMAINPNKFDSVSNHISILNINDSLNISLQQVTKDSAYLSIGQMNIGTQPNFLGFKMRLDTLLAQTLYNQFIAGKATTPIVYPNTTIVWNGYFPETGIVTTISNNPPTDVLNVAITLPRKVNGIWFVTGTFIGEFKRKGYDNKNNIINTDWILSNGTFQIKWTF